MPPRYFANAILCPAPVAPTAQLLNGTLSTLASSIRDAVNPQDPAETQKTLRWIAAQPNKQRVQPCCNYAERGVIVTQWSKFDMYKSARFEVPPALVAQPFTSLSLFDGVVYILATEDQLSQSESSLGVTVGSLDVSLALSEPIWTILDKDVRFRRHRGW